MKTDLEIKIYNFILEKKHVNLNQIIDYFIPSNLEASQQIKEIIKIQNAIKKLKDLNYIETNDKNFDYIANKIIV